MKKNPKRLTVESGHIRFETRFQSYLLNLDEIEEITVARVLSLVDEIGITLTVAEEYFFVESDDGAMEAVSALRIEEKFGSDWYARAEKGEVLKHRLTDR